MPLPLDDEIRYRLLKLIECRPDVSQRELAREIGISLGKANYCVRALVDRGWVKVRNFSRNSHKRIYVYYLTSKGVEEKAQVTARFLKRKGLNTETSRKKSYGCSKRQECKGRPATTKVGEEIMHISTRSILRANLR